MTEQQLITQMLDASPLVAFIGFLIALLFRLPGILDRLGDYQQKRNEGEKQRMQGLEAVQERAIDAVRYAVEAMTKAQADSRSFYVEKLESMRAGLSIVEDTVRDLKDQLEDKDERIKAQEIRIKELERENAVLREKLDTVNRKLEQKEARKGKNAEKKPAGPAIPGD